MSTEMNHEWALGLSELTRQTISPHFALHLLEKVGIKTTEEDKQMFYSCSSIEEIVTRLADSGTIQKLFLDDNDVGKSKLCEFYVALRCEAKLGGIKGGDVWGAFKYAELIEAGLIEVKACGPTEGHNWAPRIVSGYQKDLTYDVLVIVGLRETYNPCRARLFVIPASKLQSVLEKWRLKNRNDPRPQISISQRKYHAQSGVLNNWYKYELSDHSRLKNLIAVYLTGETKRLITYSSPQMSFFDFL